MLRLPVSGGTIRRILLDPHVVWGDTITRVRVGPDDAVYQLRNSRTTGASIARYALTGTATTTPTATVAAGLTPTTATATTQARPTTMSPTTPDTASTPPTTEPAATGAPPPSSGQTVSRTAVWALATSAALAAAGGGQL